MTIRFVICRKLSRSVKAIRNVGIIAHIDAGKTTTTERMLFNSGKIKTAGEVDQGTTITDYMDQERERGISITSATATIKWKEHNINLIDTPGHVDFTIEVERALAVLDGSITVLDSVKGVEAQTRTVWSQARHYGIPNIFYINKFDRKNANLSLCLKSIRHRLPNVVPLLIHLPYYCPKTGNFIGIIDIINFKLEYWDLTQKSSKDILTVSYTRKISDTEEIFNSCLTARKILLENLIDLDDGIIREEFLILDNPIVLIPPKMIYETLKKVTLLAKGSPVIIGSSRMNIGVVNILDNIITYLPDPSEKKLPSQFAHLAAHPDFVAALAFKVIHDKSKGPLTFLRLYSGFLNTGQSLRNLNRSINEKVEKIIQITGDRFTELENAFAGNIVAVSGLKNCFTGDLLIDKNMPHVLEDDTYSYLITIPNPVIYASLEASTLSDIKNLENALAELSKEDPSLKFHRDEETHQLIIGGMGKLHLEIILDRIINDYKLKNTKLGKIKIAYKECPVNEFDFNFKHNCIITEKMNGINIKVDMVLSASTLKDFNAKSHVELVNSRDFLWTSVNLKIQSTIKESINKGIVNGGSLLNSPVTGIKIMIHKFSVEPSDFSLLNKSHQPFIRSCVMEAARGLLKMIPTNLLEPMMKVEISFNNPDSLLNYYISNVSNDLNKRRSHVINLSNNNDSISDCITAYVPLAETGDLTNTIRCVTSGNASIHMYFSHYDLMPKITQENITKKNVYKKL